MLPKKKRIQKSHGVQSSLDMSTQLTCVMTDEGGYLDLCTTTKVAVTASMIILCTQPHVLSRKHLIDVLTFESVPDQADKCDIQQSSVLSQAQVNSLKKISRPYLASAGI